MNIREVGSYEVVFYDADYNRIREMVSHKGLMETRIMTEEACNVIEGAESFTVSKILHNSAFSTWAPKYSPEEE